MNTKLSILTYIVLLTTLLNHPSALAQKQPVDYVDPLIGTSTSRWMLYPGSSMPFGMVKLSPDNRKHAWKGGYEYNIENIMGFSHIHSWIMGGLLVMPTVGELKTIPGTEENPDEGYRSRFRHETEVASPGYYAVTLDDYDIRAELTSTTRSGFMRYTFPKSEQARILFDLKFPAEFEYDVQWAYIRKVSDSRIEGFSKQCTKDGFCSLQNEYVVHFVIQFSKPFKSFSTWNNGDIQHDTYEVHGLNDIGCFVEYDTNAGDVIKVKTGISLVSIDQALLNLTTETERFGWDFDAVRQHSRKTWNDLLGTIRVEGGTERDRIKFYTNFYRSYAARTIWSDVNGKYIDMNENICQLDDPALPVLNCDAFWNTFWNLNMLWALATPDIANQWVASLLEIYDRGGWLPKGPTGVEYSSIMVASHEVALINSVFQKGIRNYDVAKAYEAIRHVQTTPGRAHPGGGLVGNRQLEPYMRLGYVPHGPGTTKHHFGTKEEGPVSNTLEYAFDDWNVAQMAKALGKEQDYKLFTKRAYNYKNVFDIDTGYVRPRLANGQWADPKSRYGEQVRHDSWVGMGFIEGSAWQYTWFVPHDVAGLIQLMGKEEFNRRLEEGFVKSRQSNFNATGDLFAHYPINHGNQPNMQAAYLFNYSGQPWKTQNWAREIMDKYYGDNPLNGWPGDEDQGQMGAWFVMSAIGLFQMEGGGSVKPFYEIGSPLFSKITIHLDKRYYPGKTFVIEAKGCSQKNRYIQSAKLDGKPLSKCWFYHSDLIDGGSLVLQMGPKPNRSWASAPEDVPPSMSALPD
ncbi:MAG: glycoside hydrolase family 92 protein [Planctomycetes bacterium]|nr:glycoside hydrolase family 92 protein [Planctomycetota bacterium]